MITDRDLCCSIIAKGLDPKRTAIESYITRDLVTCKPSDNLQDCERLMQKHQIRRIPIVDNQGRCIGIVPQVDLALKEKAGEVQKTVA